MRTNHWLRARVFACLACITCAGPLVLGEWSASPRGITLWKSSSSAVYAPVNNPSTVVVRRWPRSSSTYCTCAICCAKSEVPDSVWNDPAKRLIVPTVALVNTAVAGALEDSARHAGQ